MEGSCEFKWPDTGVLLTLTEEARPGVMETIALHEEDPGLDLVLDHVVAVLGAVQEAAPAAVIAVVAEADQLDLPPNRNQNPSPNRSLLRKVEVAVSLLLAARLKKIQDPAPSPIEVRKGRSR